MLSSLMVKIVGLFFLVLAYNKVSLRDQPNHVTQNTQILDNCVSEVVLEKEKKVFAFLGIFFFLLYQTVLLPHNSNIYTTTVNFNHTTKYYYFKFPATLKKP